MTTHPDPEVSALLSANACLSVNEHGKIHCSVTGHDMPPRADAIRTHLAGKRFSKARDWYAPLTDLSKYAPWIVANKRDSKKVYCRLTSTTLNRIPAEIEAHMAGRRFKYWLAIAEKKGGELPDTRVARVTDDDAEEEDDGEEGDEEAEEDDEAEGDDEAGLDAELEAEKEDLDDDDDDDDDFAAVDDADDDADEADCGANSGEKRRRQVASSRASAKSVTLSDAVASTTKSREVSAQGTKKPRTAASGAAVPPQAASGRRRVRT